MCFPIVIIDLPRAGGAHFYCRQSDLTIASVWQTMLAMRD
jgi:hypothetical protein